MARRHVPAVLPVDLEALAASGRRANDTMPLQVGQVRALLNIAAAAVPVLQAVRGSDIESAERLRDALTRAGMMEG